MQCFYGCEEKYHINHKADHTGEIHNIADLRKGCNILRQQ